jgi:hypothetical protein
MGKSSARTSGGLSRTLGSSARVRRNRGHRRHSAPEVTGHTPPTGAPQLFTVRGIHPGARTGQAEAFSLDHSHGTGFMAGLLTPTRPDPAIKWVPALHCTSGRCVASRSLAPSPGPIRSRWHGATAAAGAHAGRRRVSISISRRRPRLGCCSFPFPSGVAPRVDVWMPPRLAPGQVRCIV